MATEIVDNEIVTEYSLDDTSAIYNAANRVTSFNSNSVGHDPNGNMASFADGCGTTTYAWDSNDRLVSISGYSPDCSALAASFAYDALGRRISRTAGGAEKRYVVGPGSSVMAETDAQGNVTAWYVYGHGLISKITPSDEAFHYHYDALGSTVAMTNSTGGIANNYAYGVFGQVIEEQEQVENPFKYVGAYGVMDEGNGLLFMRARYYDPEIGRFISKDPIGLAGGINMYAYVGNNPVNYVDPWGLFDNSKASGITGMVGIAIDYASLAAKGGANPYLFALDILTTKANVLLSTAPDSNAKAYTSLGLSVVGLGLAFAQRNPIAVGAAGLGFGFALNDTPIDGLNQTYGEFYVDVLYEVLHPEDKECEKWIK